MALLSPLLYLWASWQSRSEILWPFLLLLTPFLVFQLGFAEVNKIAYLKSLLNLVAIYIFCRAFYFFLKRCGDLEGIFRLLLIINFVLCIVALPFYRNSYSEFFWIEQELTKGIDGFRRLRLFTYEASYYATLFVPIFAFYLFQMLFRQNRISAILLIPMLLLPLILSFSLGVLISIIAACVLVFAIHLVPMIRLRRFREWTVVASFVALPILFLVSRMSADNALYFRLQNIFSGRDTSGNGRTWEALELSIKMLKERSEWWGIGLGQIRVMGTEIIRDFYLYPMDHAIFAIPNACAETLAIFGYSGLFLRLAAEIFLFFYTRTWSNSYRLFLFFFIFIYQFTGSFLTNHAEYVIWILAFAPVFPQFSIAKQQISWND